MDGGISEEVWTSKKVNFSFLKTFGCEAFVHIIGYGVNDFGYRFYDYEKHKIIRSTYVIFNENVLYKDHMQD